MRPLLVICCAVALLVFFLFPNNDAAPTEPRETDRVSPGVSVVAPEPLADAAPEPAGAGPSAPARRSASAHRRVRVRFSGAPAAPATLTWIAAGGASGRASQGDNDAWELARVPLIVGVQAPGFAPEIVALAEEDGEVAVELLALGDVRLTAVDAAGGPVAGVPAYLAVAFERNRLSPAERRVREADARALLAGALEPTLFDVVFERLRAEPYDALDRVLATLGNRDLMDVTDARGEIRWSGLPPQDGLSIALETDCRCEDLDGNPALSKVGELSYNELAVRRIEERRSGRFDLVPGGEVERVFRCERGGLVRGRLAPFAPGAAGTVLLRDVRRDVTLVGSSVLALNEKRVDVEPDGRFALVGKPGRKQLLAEWEEGGCSFTLDREFELAPGADLDLGRLAPPADQRAITLRPLLVDAAGNALDWSAHAAGPPPTVVLSYRVLVDREAHDAPASGTTMMQSTRCPLGGEVRLCGLPSGELRVTTLLDWGPGQGVPDGLGLRRGAGKEQRIPLRDGDAAQARVPFVLDVAYPAAVVVHADGELAPRDGVEVSGTLVAVSGDSRRTTRGQRDARGALHFTFEHAPAGAHLFYAQLPSSESRAGGGLFALAPVVVGEAPRVDAAWERGTRVELVAPGEVWDPAAEPVRLVLRSAVGEVTLDLRAAAELDGVPPGSGVELVERGRGYYIAPGSPWVRIPSDR